MRHPLLACLAVLALAAVPVAAGSPADPDGNGKDPTIDRLAGLCRLWSTVRYLHPRVALGGEVDWDAAFAGAAGRVRATGSAEEYRAAVAEMLGVLGDPATALAPAASESEEPAPAAGAPPAVELFRHLPEGMLLVAAGPLAEAHSWSRLRSDLVAGLGNELETARGVVVDLRRQEPGNLEDAEATAWVVGSVAETLVPAPVRLAAERSVVHWGYRPQSGSTSGGYRSVLVVEPGPLVEPERPAERRTVFVVDGDGIVPPVAGALQAAGLGAVVSEGPLVEGASLARFPVALPDGLTAQVRLVEIDPPLRADAVVEPASGGGDPALTEALRLVSSAAPPPPADAVPPPEPRWRPDRAYPEMALPSPEYRLLAACRLWSVIDLFYPYKHLIDDWDTVLPASLPGFLAAQDEAGYARAVLAMATHVQDGHTGVYGPHPGLQRVTGEAGLAIGVKLVEGQLVVTEAWGAAAAAGLAPLDVVLEVDGVSLDERVEALLPITPASTDVTRRTRAAARALRGPLGSKAVLTVSGGPGERRRVEVERQAWSRAPETAGLSYRVLPEGFGYVDLRRLEVPQVDAMFEALRDTPAIVFDMRGYPRGTAWAIAPRLNVRAAVAGASFRRPELSKDNVWMTGSAMTFDQRLPETPENAWLYRGRTVMLVDERTISQAEHTGLFFEAANGTEFIGTPTAGANGDVTNLVLPGGISVGFTGHDVRHADGRQLQRVGLEPHVRVEPTLAGLRAGRDEVLEKAVEYLKKKQAAEAP